MEVLEVLRKSSESGMGMGVRGGPRVKGLRDKECKVRERGVVWGTEQKA